MALAVTDPRVFNALGDTFAAQARHMLLALRLTAMSFRTPPYRSTAPRPPF
jgi:hypothetical protein